MSDQPGITASSSSVLQDRHAVALLQPERAQRMRLEHGPAAGMLGVVGRHHRRLTGIQPGQVRGCGGLLVIGDPGGGDR
jgi:hypothetical protein